MRQGWKSKEDSFTPAGCEGLMVGMAGVGGLGEAMECDWDC